MKINLVRLLFKPVGTIKHIWNVCKHVEVEFKVNVNDKSKDAPLPQDGFVSLDTYHVILPVATYELLKPALFRVDYQYVNSSKLWHIKDEKIPVSVFTKDEMTALHVAKRLGV